MARTRGKSSGTNNKADTVSSGQSTTGDGMTNSISQPDLLGDIVNKANGNNGQSTPDDGSMKNNGFHNIDDDASATTVTSDLLPDISNVIADNVDEHVELVA